MIKKFLSLLVIVGMAVSFFGPLSGQASALSGSDFRPGRIIDDVIFTNKDAMNPTQIQAFLNSKVPACDTNHSAYVGSSGTTYYPPYTCLKDYVENPTNGDNNYGRPTYNVPGGKSAAQIIWEAGQAHNINPQVLIVTLQKEQGLVTDDWPIMPQFTKAMGYLCPDTAPCSASAGGFYKQMAGAAWQFRHDLDGIGTPGYWSPYARGMNNVLYNPAGAAACGTRSVNIESQATAVLYKYTPYTPNDATLALVNDNTAGGTAPCGAYGNRNFWWYFNKWFGSTLVPTFYAQFHSQSQAPVIQAGSKAQISVLYKNVGSGFWKDSSSAFTGYPVTKLASTNPINRVSSFYDSSWAAPSRPSQLFAAVYEADGTTLAVDQHTVMTGQIAKFTATLNTRIDSPNGYFREYFQPIQEGATSWNMNSWNYFDVGVSPAIYDAQYHSQSAYPSLVAGTATNAYVRYRNAGNVAWYDDTSVQAGSYPVHLATTWPINRSSPFSAGWPNPSRPNVNFTKVYEADGVTPTSNWHVVQPGQIAEFGFSITAPIGSSGSYKEYFQPVLEGAPGYRWNMGTVTWLGVTVQ